MTASDLKWVLNNNLSRIILFSFIFILRFDFEIKAQTDSLKIIQIKSDSAIAKAKMDRKKRDPRRASLLSAILPGAGQIYNRKYWKVPILLGGGYALGYYINLNNEQYVLTRNAYLQKQAGQKDIYNGYYSTDQLVKLREYWRRNRDLLIIISALTYLLNVADAAVDAHLSGFDVSDDLTMSIQPQLQLVGRQPVYGMGLVFNLH